MSSKTLQGKTIVVTGGSMGIGLAIARQVHEQGAAVILVARHEKELKKAVGELSQASKGSVSYYILDVSQPREVKKFADYLKKSHTTIHGLVHAAGVLGPIGKTEDIDPKEFEKTVRTNLLGTVTMCQYLIPLLKKSPHGKIVSLSGGGATGPFPHYGAYAVSKIGVVRLMENIASEYQDVHLDVNAIAPGFIATRIHESTLKAGTKAGREFLARTRKEMASGGTPVRYATELAAFLLSPASNGISGKLLSAPWDPWSKASFIKRLKKDRDFCTLRRIDDQQFSKVV